MRSIKIAGFGAALALGLLGSARPAQAQDQLVLNDGRVVSGQVVEESKDQVTLLSNGVSRRFHRDMIKKVEYGAESPAEAAPGQAGTPAEAPVAGQDSAPAKVQPMGNSLDMDLSRRYQVPLSEVQWVRHQGISESDLPLVFFVAANAQVLPKPVVDLRLQGWSWRDIEDHFGVDPERVYFVPGPWVPYPFYRGPLFWGGWGWGWGWHRGFGWRRR